MIAFPITSMYHSLKKSAFHSLRKIFKHLLKYFTSFIKNKTKQKFLYSTTEIHLSTLALNFCLGCALCLVGVLKLSFIVF